MNAARMKSRNNKASGSKKKRDKITTKLGQVEKKKTSCAAICSIVLMDSARSASESLEEQFETQQQ